ncbi:hypothetical protein CPHO_03355 [Corynebacterium phocae]|uniref:DNA polymerase III subunit delta n=1 Tax=Corynebacterium phocae TaxID=161895 RepID=A0A1L7D1Z3_9CORY|nr:DNA polymerase III subunit delta [Corynebacterium phocae]APT92087.1 hypothetical protein CPHO_03355 [Corynebacterium phocae]KAA8726471.1 DNA polymerase III subunit delta [Corynebacterium phocae]
MNLAPVHLIVGDDEFLIERARQAIQAQVPGAEVTVLPAAEVNPPAILEATSPSLFAEDRVIVITVPDRAGAEFVRTLVDAAKHPAPGMTVVIIVKAKAAKNKKPPEIVAKLSRLAQVHEAYSLNPRDLLPWLTREFQSYNVRPTPDVIHAVLDGVGSDLRALASAVSQLVADTGGNVDLGAVRAYYSGIAEVANWDIADAAVAGRTEAAVSTCRRALQLGAKPVSIAFALASKVSAVARLYDARGDHFALAKDLGMNPYAVKATMPVARRWTGANVTRAVIVVDNLAAEVVGQGNDAEYAVEAAVKKICELAR